MQNQMERHIELGVNGKPARRLLVFVFVKVKVKRTASRSVQEPEKIKMHAKRETANTKMIHVAVEQK